MLLKLANVFLAPIIVHLLILPTIIHVEINFHPLNYNNYHNMQILTLPITKSMALYMHYW